MNLEIKEEELEHGDLLVRLITIVFIIRKTIFLSFKMWWHFCLLLLDVKCKEGTVLGKVQEQVAKEPLVL